MTTDLQLVEYAIQKVTVQGAVSMRHQLVTASGAFSSEEKADGSRVTGVDEEVERYMGSALRGMLESLDIVIVGEEGTQSGEYDGTKRVILYDPTDGTANVRLLAPGSTVGACLYNPLTFEFEAAAVADPWFGRLVFTQGGKTYQRSFDVKDANVLGDARSCQVSNKGFGDGGEVLIEVMHSFRRSDWLTGETRPVLSTVEITKFAAELQMSLRTKVRSLSSNLMHQLLVAVGGDGIATLMSAVGGPWDMSGIALVKGAGGVVDFLRIESSELRQVADPMQADMVLAASRPIIAEAVVEHLDEVFYRR